jgi:hypothetical protein
LDCNQSWKKAKKLETTTTTGHDRGTRKEEHTASELKK